MTLAAVANQRDGEARGRCGHSTGKQRRLDSSVAAGLYTAYGHIQGSLVNMLARPDEWTIG